MSSSSTPGSSPAPTSPSPPSSPPPSNASSSPPASTPTPSTSPRPSSATVSPTPSPPSPTTPSTSPPPSTTPSSSPQPPATAATSPPPPPSTVLPKDSPSPPTTRSKYSPPSMTPSVPQAPVPVLASPLPPPRPETPVTRPPPPKPELQPPPLPGSSSNGVSAGIFVGIAIGAIAALVVLSLLFICCKKKRRRDHGSAIYNGSPPKGTKDDPRSGQPQYWQQNAPPGTASRPPLSPICIPPSPPPALLPFMNNSGGSGSNYSGSENPLPSPSPGIALGFSKSIFTYEELAMATDGFSDANLLGQGGFGYVHRGVLPNGKEVAVKQLKAGSGQGEREFQAEVEIISRVHHKHLVTLVGYCITGSQRMLVYEFIPNSTLEFHLHGKGRPTMDWATRLKIALGSAKGLAYLHEDCNPKIIHRDIKAANILLDFNFEAKVADFGLAKLSSDANTHISTRVMGTFGYLAPEYASSGKLTDKSDVFSFGVMLLELITGRRPVDSAQKYMSDSFVDWARPLLTRALEDGNYDILVDPRLQKDYNPNEMACLIACAAACLCHSARHRSRMSQIVRALEGDASLADLNEGVRPGHRACSSYGSSDYDTRQYNEDMKKFRKMALASQEYSSSEYSKPTSEYGLYPSGSSSEGPQTTREMEMGKMKKDSRGFVGNS